MSEILIVKNLTKNYGKLKAVDGVSFSVKEGEVFGILGPNGAGKTTTLEMIEALREIDGGEIILDGINVKTDPHKVKRVIGIQLQSSSFYDKLTLDELIRLFASFYGNTIDPQQLLDEVDLTGKSKSYAENLSGGQRQRFSIAVAMVNNPRILFLDEPTTGLDPQARHNLWDLIKKIKKKGITVIMTTHYMEEAETLCDRVAIMDNGQIIALEKPAVLIKELLGRGFKKPAMVQQASLEDVFIDLTGKDLRE